MQPTLALMADRQEAMVGEEALPPVLVVDDDEDFGHMVSEMLADMGFGVQYESRPGEALRRAATEHFAVALVDVGLPEMSGMDLAERLHESSPETQIVFVTGQETLESAVAGIRSGAFDFIGKGALEMSQIEGTVTSGIERWRQLRHRQHEDRAMRREHRLRSAIADVGTAAVQAADIVDYLARVSPLLARVVEAEASRAILLTPVEDEGWLVQAASGPGADMLVGMRLGTRQGIAATVCDSLMPARLWVSAEHPAYDSRTDDVPVEHPGFLCVPLNHGTVRGALMAAGRPTPFGEAEITDLGLVASHVALGAANVLARVRAGNFFTHMCELLVTLLDGLDTPGHSHGVARLADMLTRDLGIPDEQRRTIHFAALLHDVGKLRLDPTIVRGFFPEMPVEMKGHTEAGVALLRPIDEFQEVLPLIRAHHERWDGTGYPNGLSGEDIPLGSRVIAIAEAFDAMTRSNRRRSARSWEEALTELEENSGSQFDPRLVETFVREYRIRHALLAA